VARDLDDYFVFSLQRSDTTSDLLGGTHRFSVTASLAGRPFEAFVLDVGPTKARRPTRTCSPRTTCSASLASRREDPRLHPNLRGRTQQHAHQGPHRPRTRRLGVPDGRCRAAHRDGRRLRQARCARTTSGRSASACRLARPVPPTRPRPRRRPRPRHRPRPRRDPVLGQHLATGTGDVDAQTWTTA
jgi:hypothetical protein